MSKQTLSRRDFLKLGGHSLELAAGAFFPPLGVLGAALLAKKYPTHAAAFLAGAAAGGVSACSPDAIETPEQKQDREKREAGILLDRMSLERLLRDQVETRLPQNTDNLPAVSEAIGTNLGIEAMLVANAARGAGEAAVAVKEARVDQGLADVITQVFTDIGPTGKAELMNTGTLYYSEGNLADFVVHVDHEIAGGNGYWYKFSRAPKNLNDISNFDTTVRTWEENAKLWGYYDDVTAATIPQTLRKVVFSQSDGTSRTYFVYRTPNIDAPILGELLTSGELSAGEGKKLYLEWYTKTIRYLKAGKLTTLHQDPGAQNLMINKEGSAFPFDYEGYDLAFTNNEAAAMKQTDEVLNYLDDFRGHPGLRTYGIQIEPSELYTILEAEFPGITARKFNKLNVPINAQGSNPARKIVLYYAEDELAGISNAQGLLRDAYAAQIAAGNQIPEAASVTLQTTAGEQRAINIFSRVAKLPIVDAPLVRKATSWLLAIRNMGLKILPALEVVAKLSDVVGAIMIAKEVYDLATTPGVNVEYNPLQNKWNLHLFDLGYAYDLQDSLDADKIMLQSDLVDYQAYGQLNSLFSLDQNEQDPNKIKVPPEFQTQGAGIEGSGMMQYYPLMLGLRMIEIANRIPISESGIKGMGVDQGSYDHTMAYGGQRIYIHDFITNILQRSGIPRKTNLIHTDPLTPVYGELVSRRFVNGDSVVVDFFQNTDLGPVENCRFVFSNDMKKLLNVDSLDGTGAFNLPIAQFSIQNIFYNRFGMDLSTPEARQAVVDYFNTNGSLPLQLQQ